MLLMNIPARVKWNGRNKQHFIDKGYTFTKLHEEFEVCPVDLPEGSNIYVSCECDNCKAIFETRYNQYLARKTEETYCQKCSNSIIRSQRLIRKSADVKLSFYEWCIQNNKQKYLQAWNIELNKFKPNEVYYKTQKEYWFNCLDSPNHKPEKFRLCNITEPENDINRGAKSCRQCYVESEQCKLHLSNLEYLIRIYMVNKYCMYTVNYEYGCTLQPVNPKTNRPLPFDNEIEELKLIIEVHGGHHYETNGWNTTQALKNNTTPEQELQYQQWKDAYKKQYALDNGYEYLEIPYWTEKDESYKTLIDNKIASILSSAPQPNMKPKYRVS